MVLSVTHELRREWAFFLLPDRFWGFFVAIYDHFSLATDRRQAVRVRKATSFATLLYSTHLKAVLDTLLN